jgi:hypothetical protein
MQHPAELRPHPFQIASFGKEGQNQAKELTKAVPDCRE